MPWLMCLSAMDISRVDHRCSFSHRQNFTL